MIDLLRGLLQFYIPGEARRQAYNNVSVNRLEAVRSVKTYQVLMSSAWLFEFQGYENIYGGDKAKLPAFYAQIWERL